MKNWRSREHRPPDPSVSTSSTIATQLNVYKTALSLIVLYFVVAGVLGAVLAAFGIKPHPLGLLVLWFASAAFVAQRIAMRYEAQPPVRLCAISIGLSILIYAMLAVAVGLRTQVDNPYAVFGQMLLFSAVMLAVGLLAFRTIFKLRYDQ